MTFPQTEALIRFSCSMLVPGSLKFSIRNNDQDLFQPRCIKDNRAHCTQDEDLSEALAGNRSLPGQMVLGIRAERTHHLRSCPWAAAQDMPLLLNAHSGTYTEVWGWLSISFEMRCLGEHMGISHDQIRSVRKCKPWKMGTQQTVKVF